MCAALRTSDAGNDKISGVDPVYDGQLTVTFGCIYTRCRVVFIAIQYRQYISKCSVMCSAAMFRRSVCVQDVRC